jgi:mannose-6-phosphate isomerase-like protein (cupin superfamily)
MADLSRIPRALSVMALAVMANGAASAHDNAPALAQASTQSPPYGAVSVPSERETLPSQANTIIVDRKLVNHDGTSARIFRVYRASPPHSHATSDEYLYILSGRARFFFGDEPPREVGPGTLVYFKRGTKHGVSEILEGPLDFMSFDIPPRNPTDIVFEEPGKNSPDTFIRSQPSR